jgi:anti-sigma factor RsiW
MIRRHPRNTPGALNCIQVGRVLQRHLDGELDADTARLVALHLEDCRRCGMTAHEYRSIKRALSDAGRDDAAIARLRDFAASLGEAASERPTPPGEGDVPHS